MCPGNRSATIIWLNQQLQALWKVSDDCVAKHGRKVKPSSPEIALSTCLAQLCVGGSRFKTSIKDTSFFCEFAAPEIDFICNHDVLLLLNIKSGQFRHAHGKDKGLVEHFGAHTCAFRVPFRQHLITDTTYSCYGQPDICKATFIILDLNAAEFVAELSPYALENNEIHGRNTQRTIVKYLRTEYMPLLQRAGCHFIHSLPDFGSLNHTHRIDWSMTTTVAIETLHVFNVGVELINSFLNRRWIEHCGCVDNLEDSHDHSNFGEYALAEHRGTCEDFDFHAFFGPPEVRALCSKEALFTINIQDLAIYMENGYKGGVTHHFKDWKIVVVTEIHTVQTEGGSLQRLKLDFTQARFCEGLSSFLLDFELESSIFIKIRTMFIRYIMRRYLLILEEYEHSHIYRIDVSVVDESIYVDEEVLIDLDFEFLEEECRERLCITDTFRYDMITVVTQACINNHFRCLWKASQLLGGCISEWFYDKYFHANFGPIQIRLPHDSSSNTVIIFLTLEKGEFALLDCFRNCIDGERETFSKWRIAFKVQIKLREYQKKHAISDGYLRDRESVGQFVNYQLVLDFETAKFSQKLSRLPGLFDETQVGTGRRRRTALLRYITRHYLPALHEQGHHVLYTFPIWKADSHCGYNDFSPTSFSFQFYGPSFGEVVTGNHHRGGNRNMIAICGMINNRNRPPRLPRCTWSWCSSQDIFCGSVVLSRSVFLERWLLKELSIINCRTTFIPSFKGCGDSRAWDFVLETMEGDAEGICEWRQTSADCHKILFEHRNKKTWSYNHVDDSCDVHDGGYNISCETINTLILPTVSKHGGCNIVMSGTVTLDMNFKGERQSWSSSSTAEWSYTISIVRCGAGLGLDIRHSGYCNVSDDCGYIDDSKISKPIEDASTILKAKLAGILLVNEKTIERLKASFCGVWPMFYSGAYGYTLCNPCFNERGDFILELESPLDCAGRSIVGDRCDVCLPAKQLGYEQHSRKFSEIDTHIDHRPKSERSATLVSDGDDSTRHPSPEHVNHDKFEKKRGLAYGHSDSSDDEEHVRAEPRHNGYVH